MVAKQAAKTDPESRSAELIQPDPVCLNDLNCLNDLKLALLKVFNFRICRICFKSTE